MLSYKIYVSRTEHVSSESTLTDVISMLNTGVLTTSIINIYSII